jgi:hypothetical protein
MVGLSRNCPVKNMQMNNESQVKNDGLAKIRRNGFLAEIP